MKRILLLLLLVSCTGPATELYTSEEGLLVDFIRNTPPPDLKADRAFPVQFRIRNTGAADVAYTDAKLTFSYDPTYLDGTRVFELTPYNPQETILHGKSAEYPDGESRIYKIPKSRSFKTKPLSGRILRPETTLVANLCYKYNTVVSVTDICIDTNVYDENVRPQSCHEEDLTIQTRGAPVVVTQVDVDSIPVYDSVEIDQFGDERIVEVTIPRFTITIADVGRGHVVAADTISIEDACVQKNIPEQAANAVRVEAEIPGTKLRCQPALVRLHEGEGETTCTVRFEESSIYDVTQNFRTTLTVNLSYYYRTAGTAYFTIEQDKLQKDTTIQRQRGYLYKDGEVVRGEIEEGELVEDDEADPVVLCDYYAANPVEAPDAFKSIDSRFSCACSRDLCNEYKRKGGECFADRALCPGTTFCCALSKKEVAKTTTTAYDACCKRTSEQHGVTRNTKMPAVLVETLLITNEEQRTYYAQTAHQRALAEKIGEGIVNYVRKYEPHVKHIIIDNGHGEEDPGAVTGTVTEKSFTKPIWTHTINYLSQQLPNVKVHGFSYTGTADVETRITEYVTKANALDPQGVESLYISIHADARTSGNGQPQPPMVYHSRTKYDASILAREILAVTTPYHNDIFA